MTVVARINSAVQVLLAILLGVATVSIALQVTIRFLLTRLDISISAPWTEELCRYSVIWLVFLGAAVLCRQGRLIAVDYLLHRLTPKAARWVQIFAGLITLAFFIIVGWLGLKMAITSVHETSPVMRISMSYVYAAVPVSAVLALVNCMAHLIAPAADDQSSLDLDTE